MAKFVESDSEGNVVKQMASSTIHGIIEYARRTNDSQKLGEVLLHCANFGHVEVMRELLDEDLTTVDFADDATGLTALHIAVGTDSLRTAKFLVERGGIFPRRQTRPDANYGSGGMRSQRRNVRLHRRGGSEGRGRLNGLSRAGTISRLPGRASLSGVSRKEFSACNPLRARPVFSGMILLSG